MSPSTAEVYESLTTLMSAKTEWTWNATLQKMFDKAKAIIKDVYMKFYDENKPLYIETDVSGIGLGAALVQIRSYISCHRFEVPGNSILRPLHFPARASPGQKRDTAILKKKHWAYCVALKNSIIIASPER